MACSIELLGMSREVGFICNVPFHMKFYTLVVHLSAEYQKTNDTIICQFKLPNLKRMSLEAKHSFVYAVTISCMLSCLPV